MKIMKNILFVVLLYMITSSYSVVAQHPTQLTSFAEVIEPLMPSVVNIYTVKYDRPNQYSVSNSFLPQIVHVEHFNNFLQQFNVPFSFSNLHSNPQSMSLGSGFIVSAEGHIITNDHVVHDSDEIYVKLSNGDEFLAKIVGSDPKTDIALLKINSKSSLPAVKFANSKQARIGDIVIAIGNPLGFGGTVTTGIISSKGRDLGATMDEIVDDFIQTDAAINSGSSGGPLFNINGEVIGINTSIPNVGTGANIGISFAIPSDTVQKIMEELKSRGKINRGRLDITIQDITAELVEALSLNKNYGVLVADVYAGGTGDKAGLKRGDLIIGFNNQDVLNSRKLQLFIADSLIGEEVNLTVIRENKLLDVGVKILSSKAKAENKSTNIENTLKRSGIIFADLSSSLIEKFGIDDQSQAVVVIGFENQVNTNIQIGDIIVSINEQAITNIREFDKIYNQTKKNNKQNVPLLIKRGNLVMFVTLPIN